MEGGGEAGQPGVKPGQPEVRLKTGGPRHENAATNSEGVLVSGRGAAKGRSECESWINLFPNRLELANVRIGPLMFVDDGFQPGEVRFPHGNKRVAFAQNSKQSIVAFMSGKSAQPSAIFWEFAAFAPSGFYLDVFALRVHGIETLRTRVLNHLQTKRPAD